MKYSAQSGGAYADIQDVIESEHDKSSGIATRNVEPAKCEWQPIETAPEHGQFLVYMPDEPRNKIQAAEWHPNVKVIGNLFAFDLTKPTHWMPLPEPPLLKPSEKGKK